MGLSNSENAANTEHAEHQRWVAVSCSPRDSGSMGGGEPVPEFPGAGNEVARLPGPHRTQLFLTAHERARAP